MKNLAIRMQTTIIAIIAVVGFAITAGIYLTSNVQLKTALSEEEQAFAGLRSAEGIKYDFLNARRNEKDFLIRLDNKYAGKHAKTSEKVIAGLEHLKTIHEEPEVHELINNVEKHFEEYVHQFEKVQKMWTIAGYTPKEGLRGELRKAVQAVEKKLAPYDVYPLTIKMLMMRRHEKDFLMRRDAKYIDRMAKRKIEFEQQIAWAPIPDDAKGEILKLMNVYHEKFNALAKIQLDLAPATKNLSKLFAVASPELDELVAGSIEDMEISKNDAHDTMSNATIMMVAAMVMIAVLVGVVGLLIGRGIAKPIGAITEAMQHLAERNLEVHIPGQSMKNELGTMASAVKVFKDNMVKADELAAAQAAEQEAKMRRSTMLEQSIGDFESELSNIVTSVSSGATSIVDIAEQMGSKIDNSASRSLDVAEASGRTTSNVETVASAAEELSASIAEISRQVSTGSEMASSAEKEAIMTNKKVQGLSDAANKIGEVVELINDIADQTNLLALNATIEAARAGEAGKGFAVVASEVKNLANQTAKATEEIGIQISDMQRATVDSAEAIRGFGETIAKISETSSATAAAVEQQGAATQEIARNIREVSEDANLVSGAVADVSRASAASYSSAIRVIWGGQDLNQPTQSLRSVVDTFLNNVRAA